MQMILTQHIYFLNNLLLPFSLLLASSLYTEHNTLLWTLGSPRSKSRSFSFHTCISSKTLEPSPTLLKWQFSLWPFLASPLLFFFFFNAVFVAYGSSQARARDWIWATAAVAPTAPGQGSNSCICSSWSHCRWVFNPLCPSGNSFLLYFGSEDEQSFSTSKQLTTKWKVNLHQRFFFSYFGSWYFQGETCTLEGFGVGFSALWKGLCWLNIVLKMGDWWPSSNRRSGFWGPLLLNIDRFTLCLTYWELWQVECNCGAGILQVLFLFDTLKETQPDHGVKSSLEAISSSKILFYFLLSRAALNSIWRFLG